MHKITRSFVTILVISIIVGAATFWWQQRVAAPPTASTVITPLLDLPKPLAFDLPKPQLAPQIEQPIEAVDLLIKKNQVSTPNFQDSPNYVRDALITLATAQHVLKFLQIDQFIQHLVATVDNLPRKHAPTAAWPINPIEGRFSTGHGDQSDPTGATTVHPNNSLRYRPFVTFIESIETTQLIALYKHLYPLIQQTYAELGYSKAFFNDRLIVVIDDLLAAPVQTSQLGVERVEVKGPFNQARPWVTYEFTNPELSELSAGQKMLLRAGQDNHQRLRNKLIEIKAGVISKSQVTKVH